MNKVKLKSEEKQYPPMFELSSSDMNWIETRLGKMSLREKCAQMIMPWVLGEFINEDSTEYRRIVSLVKDEQVGGLIFFNGDILNEAMIINKMQKLAKIPLLIASDFERGLGMRLKDGIKYPYNMALAAAGDKNLAYKMGRDLAVECRAIGVTQNYAPVADVNNNPDNPIINIRAYSENQNVVAEYCSEFIKGTTSERILTTAKHFPGHGNTRIDSHQDLPMINLKKPELNSTELVPFKKSIKAGVHSIMVGHLAVPALDSSGIPATLSKPIITGLLKKKLGFKGLVVTDAMNMSAVTKYYSAAEAAVKAIEAGVDLLLMPPDEQIAIGAIVSAVKTRRIKSSNIDESVRKILAAKAWLKINQNRYSILDTLTKTAGKKSHLKLAHEIAEKSITLVRNNINIIPVDPYKYEQIACISVSGGDDFIGDILFHKLTENNFRYVRHIALNDKSSKMDYDKAYQIARHSDLIFLPSFVKVKAYLGTIGLPKEKQNFINKVLKLKVPAIIISFGNPYLLSVFPSSKTYLCAYGDPFVSQKAMMKAILGELNIVGKLPVSIPLTEHKIGHGIQIKHS